MEEDRCREHIRSSPAKTYRYHFPTCSLSLKLNPRNSISKKSSLSLLAFPTFQEDWPNQNPDRQDCGVVVAHYARCLSSQCAVNDDQYCEPDFDTENIEALRMFTVSRISYR